MTLTVSHLTFAYPKAPPVLEDVSFTVPAGDFLSVLGANGAGKSTLFRCLLGGLEDSDSPDYLDTLLDILGGNPEDYGAYFSQMVQTSVEPVYPIDNYGSAMAPFYSVLAIWVGGVMLVAILKPHARREGLVAPKPYQLFFGRYFLFFALSQIQAAVIVAGDLLVLKIQCVEPALLFATGAITSLVFSLLIYSLTISFGDVGKAVVVVVMVLQIAG